MTNCKNHRQIGQYFKQKYSVDDKAMWEWLKKVEKYSMASVLQAARIQDLRGEFPSWNSWYVLLETFKDEVKLPEPTGRKDDMKQWGENLKNWTQGRITFYQYTKKALEIGQMTMSEYNTAVQDRMYERPYRYAVPHGCGFSYIDNRMNL